MEKIKAFFIAAFTTLSSWLGILFVPCGLLAMANIIDYITGLMAAPYRGEKRNSYKGIQGIKKKVCMWLLVIVGVMVDIALNYAATTLGWTIPLNFVFGCLVAVWILANEILSILENIIDMDVNVPPFLAPIVEWVKKKAEDSATVKEEMK